MRCTLSEVKSNHSSSMRMNPYSRLDFNRRANEQFVPSSSCSEANFLGPLVPSTLKMEGCSFHRRDREDKKSRRIPVVALTFEWFRRRPCHRLATCSISPDPPENSRVLSRGRSAKFPVGCEQVTSCTSQKKNSHRACFSPHFFQLPPLVSHIRGHISWQVRCTTSITSSLVNLRRQPITH